MRQCPEQDERGLYVRLTAPMKKTKYDPSWVDEAEGLSAILDDDWRGAGAGRLRPRGPGRAVCAEINRIIERKGEKNSHARRTSDSV